jgi:hypothetical protein
MKLIRIEDVGKVNFGSGIKAYARQSDQAIPVVCDSSYRRRGQDEISGQTRHIALFEFGGPREVDISELIRNHCRGVAVWSIGNSHSEIWISGGIEDVGAVTPKARRIAF